MPNFEETSGRPHSSPVLSSPKAPGNKEKQKFISVRQEMPKMTHAIQVGNIYVHPPNSSNVGIYFACMAVFWALLRPKPPARLSPQHALRRVPLNPPRRTPLGAELFHHVGRPLLPQRHRNLGASICLKESASNSCGLGSPYLQTSTGIEKGPWRSKTFTWSSIC